MKLWHNIAVFPLTKFKKEICSIYNRFCVKYAKTKILQDLKWRFKY